MSGWVRVREKLSYNKNIDNAKNLRENFKPTDFDYLLTICLFCKQRQQTTIAI